MPSSLLKSTTTKRLRIRLLYLLIVLFVVGNISSSNNNYNYDINIYNNNNNNKRQVKEEEPSNIFIDNNNNTNPTYIYYPQTEENEEKVLKEQQQPSSLAATTTTDTNHSNNNPPFNVSLLLQQGFNEQPYYTMDNYTYYVTEQFDPKPSQSNNNTDDQVVVVEKEKKTICFVKCSYGNSINDIDKFNHNSNSVKRLKMLSGYQFYYITNLPEINVGVTKLGWKTILLPNLPFQRQITSSRYGKFMSWRIPLISNNCHTIFYLDGQITLTVPSQILDISKTIDSWSNVANQIHNSSSSGLLQQPHPKYDVMGEIDAITRQGKDTKENMGITLKWIIEQQPSTIQLHDIKLYVNTIFGYNPTNVQYQVMSNEFWLHYSKEYGSWRDQLIWGYFLYKYQIKPIWSSIIINKLTRVSKNLKGFGGHKYVNVTTTTKTKNTPTTTTTTTTNVTLL